MAQTGQARRIERTLTIPTELAEKAKWILGQGGPLDGFPSIYSFYEGTTQFVNGVEVDVKVCNGDTPYVDVVWFRNGHEVMVEEPSDDLFGESVFEHDGIEYVLNVEQDDSEMWVIPNEEDGIFLVTDDAFRRSARLPLDQEGWVVVDGRLYPLLGEEFVGHRPTGGPGLYLKGGFLNGEELKEQVSVILKGMDTGVIETEAKEQVQAIADHLGLPY